MKTVLLFVTSITLWGQAAWLPTLPDGIAPSTGFTANAITASDQLFSFCGFVWTPAGTAKNIQNVGILFGTTITKAGGSALTLSLQNASTTTGPPMQPDGTPDETVAISNAQIAFSTFLLTGALSANRSVVHGESLCVVIGYDGAGRLGSDSIQIAGWVVYGQSVLPTYSTYAPSTWTGQTRIPTLVFAYSDGTYGTLDGAVPWSAIASHAFNSGTAGADEHALKMSFPTAGTIDGVYLPLTLATGADFDLVLYDGTTAIRTVSMDSNQWGSGAINGSGFVSIPATAVNASTTYYLAVKPTTANNVTISSRTLANNAYLGALPQGTGWIRSTRLDGGAWTDVNTSVPVIRVRFTPTSSGGGGGGAYVVAQ